METVSSYACYNLKIKFGKIKLDKTNDFLIPWDKNVFEFLQNRNLNQGLKVDIAYILVNAIVVLFVMKYY